MLATTDTLRPAHRIIAGWRDKLNLFFFSSRIEQGEQNEPLVCKALSVLRLPPISPHLIIPHELIYLLMRIIFLKNALLLSLVFNLVWNDLFSPA